MDDCLEQWRGSIEGARRFPLGRYGNGSMFDMALHFKWGINRLGNFDEKIVTIIGGARVLPNWKSVGRAARGVTTFSDRCPSRRLVQGFSQGLSQWLLDIDGFSAHLRSVFPRGRFVDLCRTCFSIVRPRWRSESVLRRVSHRSQCHGSPTAERQGRLGFRSLRHGS